MKTLKINIVAVIVLTIAFQVTNFGWYTLAGQGWLDASGLTEARIQAEQSPLAFVVSTIHAVLFCFMIAWLFVQLRVESVLKGVLLAVSFYGCFIFFAALTGDIFHLRSFRLTMINEGIGFVNYAIAGAVLGVWRKYDEK
jgi:apolipoprotein N-acyltransferase